MHAVLRPPAIVGEDPGFSEKTWSQLAEMGVLGLPFAESDGGMGAGPVEVSIVAEEIGRVIAPWGRRIGDLRFETEGAWKRSGTTVDSLAKELRLALQYPEGAAV